ncbi:iron-containing alcohol dehydrogenase [Myxococcaceae bacterium GXIMD 01537]
MTPPSAELRKFVTPEIIYGSGARLLVGRYARNLGAGKLLVVSDPGVVSAGWTADVLASLEQEGLRYSLFTGVTPNPRAEEVARGVEACREAGCEAIIAVGGGSTIDCAKGVGIVLANEAPILEFEGVDRIENPIPPLICIPTTSGSSADVSQFAIITDTERQVKVSIISKAIVPDLSLVDYATTRTLTPYLVACSGMDAFIHSIEAYVSNAQAPLTNMYALAALSLIWSHLPAAMRDPPDEDARAQVMVGSLEAGLAFSNASLGAIHAMAHSLGGLVDNPHGEANAMLVDHVVAFNYEAVPERFDDLAQRLGVETVRLGTSERKQALLTRLRQLKRAAGLDLRMRDRGVVRSDIPLLARRALVDLCMATNPRRPTLRDIEVLYEEAL